jgi:hypothetical protein
LLLSKSWTLWLVNDSCQMTSQDFAQSESAKLENCLDIISEKKSGHAALDRSMLMVYRTHSLNYHCKTQHKCSQINVTTSLKHWENSQTLTWKVVLNKKILQLPLVIRWIHFLCLMSECQYSEELFFSTIFP